MVHGFMIFSNNCLSYFKNLSDCISSRLSGSIIVRRTVKIDSIKAVVLCSSGAGDDNPYSLHTENYSDLFGPNYIKELSDWSTHQQTLMP